MNTQRKVKNIVSFLMITCILLTAHVAPALAAAPGNDNFADATQITSIPFADSVDTSEATTEPGEPVSCAWNLQKTIWYSFTPTVSGVYTATIDGWDWPNLGVYTGADIANLQLVSCQMYQATLQLEAGTTYYFQLTNNSYLGGTISFNLIQLFPPANDNFASATAILETPFSEMVELTLATTEPGEPWVCGSEGQKTIWYTITPTASGLYKIESDGPDIQTLVAYTGSDLLNLQPVDCSVNWVSRLVLPLQAGTTYYFQTFNNDAGFSSITFNMTQVFRPSNDDFSNATQVAGVPFYETVDTSYATIEPGEPNPSGWNFQQTVWYTFSPADSGSYTAEGLGYAGVVAAYTGADVSNLQLVGWGSDRITLFLNGGTTYYYQTYSNEPWWNPSIQFGLYTAPPPVASFSYGPWDPMKNETMQFYNESYDPGGSGFQGSGFQACAWDFGDGSTTADCYPSHAFSADGDYTVQLTITTMDGRSASTTQTIQVRTHDVGITRFVAPTSARVGQTRQLTVYVKSLPYPETVQVDLFRSTAGGFEWVDSLTQEVPLTQANRTSAFTFNYTFTSQDADMGKVNFKTVVTIMNARDSFPADNERVSFATKVSR